MLYMEYQKRGSSFPQDAHTEMVSNCVKIISWRISVAQRKNAS